MRPRDIEGIFGPEKGAVQSKHYDETKHLLQQCKEVLLCELPLDGKGTKIFERVWPFDD